MTTMLDTYIPSFTHLPSSEVVLLETQLAHQKLENAALQRKILSLETIRSFPKGDQKKEDCVYYTGFPNFEAFFMSFKLLEAGSGGDLQYWRCS